MPTPDSTSSPSIRRQRNQRRDTSPTKKRKVLQRNSDNRDDEDDVSDDDTAQTPRSQRLPLRTSQQSLPPSSTSSAGLSRRPSRRASPVKKKQALIGLEKPVQFNELYAPAQQLPADVRSLYGRIRNIAYYHSNYLPLQDREMISRAVGEEIPDFSFKKATEGTIPVPARTNSDFDELQEILFTSYECRKLDRSELAVNMLVHAPLLKLALKNHHYVDEELIQTARICPPFMPPLADIGDKDGKVTEGKMVDLALVLTPAEDGSRALGRKPKGNMHDTAADKRLLRAIQTHVLHREPPEAQTINQTAYTPVMFRPIATSIETKGEGGAEEGKLQLGIWTSAWHRRMVSLISKLEQRGDGGSQPLWSSVSREIESRVITLPLILILGNEWKLLFACDRGDSLEILGDVPIGETSTLLGLYTIIAVLHEVADWIQSSFREWIMNVFMIND
ncbi:hypothetical protein PWT90_08938 [Aphanocladium album]|nr:hypothetical protein PWT90_08938 [Aphanocladium album]